MPLLVPHGVVKTRRGLGFCGVVLFGLQILCFCFLYVATVFLHHKFVRHKRGFSIYLRLDQSDIWSYEQRSSFPETNTQIIELLIFFHYYLLLISGCSRMIRSPDIQYCRHIKFFSMRFILAPYLAFGGGVLFEAVEK